MTKNNLDMEQWLLTYGKVYRELINADVQSIMSAHIAFPAYIKKLKPGVEAKDILPATLTPELNFNLLRKELGFKGLIVSDATNMVALCAKGNRSDIVPRVVAAGCDIFLFNKNCFEDFDFMLSGLDSGILDEERLDEAVLNILSMKAFLGLHERKKNDNLVPSEEKLDIVGCREHEALARECADNAITLAKDSQGLIPITPEKYGKILLVGLGGLKKMFSDEAEPVTGEFKTILQNEGFVVTEFDARSMGFEMLSSPVERFKEKYDLVIYLAVIAPHSNVGSLRISWIPPLGFDAPWFACEMPTLFISCANPYHFYDVPDIRTLVNTYSYSTTILEELIKKLTGKTPFKGTSPVDPFCGLDEAAL
jgi:beta-N-acetylhexosaminidase